MTFKEIAGSLYAWDLVDEKLDNMLDTLQEKALVNSVYLISPMHHEKRPLTDYYYPHNPVRKVYYPEDSRVYHEIHPEYYRETKIKPQGSQRDFLKGVDWIDVLTKAARKRGLKTGAEVSHSIVPWEYSNEEFPECKQQDVYGNHFAKGGINPWGIFNLCPNSEDVRNYIKGLFADVVANHDIDMVQTCMLFFHPGHTLFGARFPSEKSDLLRLLSVSLGGCFCPSCDKRARDKGLDWDAIKKTVKGIADALNAPTPESFHERDLLTGGDLISEGLLLEKPEYYQWLKFRCDSVTEVFSEIYGAVKKEKPEVEFRYNGGASIKNLNMGVNIRDAHRYMDSIRLSGYAEESGDEKMLEVKKGQHLNLRRIVGEEKKVVAAIGIRPKATAEIIKKGVITAAFAGADGLSLGHYDGATTKSLEAVKEGIVEAEIVTT